MKVLVKKCLAIMFLIVVVSVSMLDGCYGDQAFIVACVSGGILTAAALIYDHKGVRYGKEYDTECSR